jgi:hypothetical protein
VFCTHFTGMLQLCVYTIYLPSSNNSFNIQLVQPLCCFTSCKFNFTKAVNSENRVARSKLRERLSYNGAYDMRVSVPILEMLRSEHRLSRMVLNPPYAVRSYNYTQHTCAHSQRLLKEHKHVVRMTNAKATAHALWMQEAGIYPIFTLACWYDLCSLLDYTGSLVSSKDQTQTLRNMTHGGIILTGKTRITQRKKKSVPV